MTVTVWFAFQLPWVKVSDDGDTLPSVASVLVTAMVTLPAGRVRSRTGNVALSPSSVSVPATSPTTKAGSAANTNMLLLSTRSPSAAINSAKLILIDWSVLNEPV